MWRKAGRSAASPAACVELGSAVMDEDRTLWMLKPGTGSTPADLDHPGQ
jgi:hypothetical protein